MSPDGGIGRGFIVAWVVSVLASIGMTIAIVYVAAHFVAKFW